MKFFSSDKETSERAGKVERFFKLLFTLCFYVLYVHSYSHSLKRRNRGRGDTSLVCYSRQECGIPFLCCCIPHSQCTFLTPLNSRLRRAGKKRLPELALYKKKPLSPTFLHFNRTTFPEQSSLPSHSLSLLLSKCYSVAYSSLSSSTLLLHRPSASYTSGKIQDLKKRPHIQPHMLMSLI